MTTKLSTDNFQQAALDAIGGAPVISNVRITDSSYNVLDDTAISLSGGFLRIEGRKFAANCQVLIEETPASAVSFVNSSVVTAQVQARAAGTYMVYVVNPDGSTGIRINGLTYSDTPTWVTSSALSNTITEFTFSQQLSATGANSYAVAAGSSLPAGVTLASNGLLSGSFPKARSNTTYNFTITAIDGELQDSPRAFTQTVVPDIDPHYMDVPLMLTGSGVAGGNSTVVVLDSSATNNAISATGNVAQSTWSPYVSEEWSLSFNGSNSFVSTTNTTPLAFGANNWTVEAWVRLNAMPTSDAWPANYSGFMVLVAVGTPSLGDGFDCLIGQTKLGIQSNDTGLISAVNHDMVINTWYHVAFVRDGNTIRFFVDGVAKGTASFTGSVGTGSALYIGTETNQGAYFNGLIRELRVTRNQSLYTAAFTPSATTLGGNADTTLLVGTSRHMNDVSVSQLNLTPTNIRMVPISRKNDKSARYSSNTSLGSVYYFADGQNIRTAASVMNFGTNDFTVEGWINLETMPTTDNWALWSNTTVLVGAGTPTTPDGFACIVGNTVLFVQSDDVVFSSNVPHGIKPGSWFHIAYVRQSGVVNFYVNGEARGNVAFANAVGTGANTYIGSETGEGAWLRGYLSDLRVVNGVAIYTAPFTPPSTPLPTVANTTLHVRMNQVGIADASVNTVTFSTISNSVVLTSAQSRYYGTSLAFNGANTVMATNSSIMAFGANNWTVEAWVRLNALPTSDAWPTNFSSHMILIGSGTTNLGDGMACIIGQTKLLIHNNDTQFAGTAHGMAINTWYHIAYVRDGTTIRFFVNGTPTGTATLSGSVGTGAFTWIGNETGQGAYLNGFINDLRVTRNVARYTSAFTPPITTLPLAA